MGLWMVDGDCGWGWVGVTTAALEVLLFVVVMIIMIITITTITSITTTIIIISDGTVFVVV